MENKKKAGRNYTKSSTGCRTCRTRHVKCDEAPGSCRKCTKAGFKCDGYDLERLPHKRKPVGVTLTLTEYQFRQLLPDKTPEERRFFNYFHSFTVPMMNGWFDNRMWNCLVLQMCQAEPALCHAVVAVSALQEVSETNGIDVWPVDMSNRTHRFALYQYTRSIERLRERMKSNDPTVRHTVLLCCLLFIAFELIRGNYNEAILHLQNGLQILGTDKLDYHALYHTNPVFDQPVEESLAAAMVHLDLQCAHFGLSETHRPLSLALLAEGQGQWPMSADFDCVQQAWFMRDRIFLQFCMFARFCETLSAAEISANHALLSKEQKKQQIQLLNFGQALDRLEQKAIRAGTWGEKERGSMEVLRMHHLGVSVIIDTCMIKSVAVLRRSFGAHFSAVVDAAERITQRILRKSRESGPRPTLLMETAIIGPLYYTIEKCRNPAVAQRGLAVLESWPHREGMWDSTLAAGMARSAVKEIYESPEVDT
ncbi:hypothetical protein BJX99DRAFT_219429 [Aspergillus californicus]